MKKWHLGYLEKNRIIITSKLAHVNDTLNALLKKIIVRKSVEFFSLLFPSSLVLQFFVILYVSICEFLAFIVKIANSEKKN